MHAFDDSTWPTPTHPPSALGHRRRQLTSPSPESSLPFPVVYTPPPPPLPPPPTLTCTACSLTASPHHTTVRPWPALCTLHSARRHDSPHGRRKHGSARGATDALAPQEAHDAHAPVVDTIAHLAVAHRGRLPASPAQGQPPSRCRRAHAAHHVGGQEPDKVCQSEPSSNPRSRRRHPPPPPLAVGQLAVSPQQPTPWLQAQRLVGRHCPRGSPDLWGPSQELLEWPSRSPGPG
jgi:hypothetical protein